ncbi:Enoyl-CoA hydratase (EC / Delta(3)-cis-delta(2)-trans-enoyl-CoA isomerase (EC / 3-hydroxyacyl-CoA dehydrogenase (EC / 3-hydroxybutyryl-CoA epimerase (EC [Olavius algarvensis Delta 1 endosymbiont]|nr:Enoyl-CoA hydratase (EC / Delta(3)-cis-delta(2)-trans-enoyl-CoA isomerase (EC / 3-hydroxyacyl-CoA dehydrogenase (EC / 3-hydroxybutyryl-CoA epimerase (EC [Olavius algarvensis Delta 1 endosymbiont]
MSIITYEIKDDIGVIMLNNPPVNALSQALRAGLKQAIENAQKDASKALVIICEGRTFIAGFDITEFGKPPRAPSLPDMLDTIEASEKPVIAAMHGTALGGGFETALTCHYRCALTSAKVGLPEVNLGLLPGAGGTQRVPRLAGVEAALDLITSGKSIPAAKAFELGLIDRVIDADLHQGAIAYAKELVSGKAELRRVRDIRIDPATVPADLFDNYRAKLAKRMRGRTSPQHIVTCIEAAVNLPMDQGLQKEREWFRECRNSSQSAALRHMFFAERESAKIKGLSKDIALRDIKRVGIIGGGTMGGGIAMCFANAGIPVTLLEINDDALQRGKDIIAKNYGISVKKGKLSAKDAVQRQELIRGTLDYSDLANADLVIEAVFENLDIKKEVFTKLDSVCKQGAILATNTSYLDVNRIAEATSRPEDVIGLHFFSPANIMKLLEIVKADKTKDDVLATSMALAGKIKKVPALSRVCYGFIGNRMLRQYAQQAQLCMIEGGSPEQIDSVLQTFGMAMGPLAVGDLAGLDIGYKARQGLTDRDKGDLKTYKIADTLVEMGRLGQKSGAGYYQYDPQTRKRTPDPAVMDVIVKVADDLGVSRKEVDDEEILNRHLYALINEGVKILEEGIAQRPGDIDVVWVFGYGFPAHKGGPMHLADTIGLKKVYDTICDLRDTLGEAYWKPAALLEQLVKKNKTLSQWAAGIHFKHKGMR